MSNSLQWELKVERWNGEPISRPGVFSNVPIDVYHGPALCAGPSISSSGLRKIFTQSPMAYWIESPLNPNALEQDDKEAFILGRAAHHLFLGEADFHKHFAVEPETYPDAKTGAKKPWANGAIFCKDWHAAIANEGKTALTRKQLEAIKGMAGVLPWQAGLEDSGLANHAIVRAGALRGLVEHTIVVQDKETGIWLRSRPDVIPLDSNESNDLKTTASVDDRSLEKTLNVLRYDMQMETVARCLREAAGIELTSFAFVFVEKKAPFGCRTLELDPKDFGDAADDNRAALRTFAHCLETGRWPGPGGSVNDAVRMSRSDRSRADAAGRRAILEMELAR